MSADAIEFGILEALTIQKVEFCKFYGIHVALQEIESFEDAHNETWAVYLKQKEQNLGSQIQELQKALVDRAKTRSSKTGKLAKTLMEQSLISQRKREQQAQDLEVLVNAFIGSSTT
ncbi:MAG: hypothetical protein PUP92_27885 [Rhizonema sp. PD38]|nr:hypothetical protein [Rhizonema sp. PD38]